MANIVVIDDEAGIRRVTSRTLEIAGHHVVAFADGRAGLDHIAREVPDLLITDIFMPEMEGLETIMRVRAIDANLPIIAMSGISIEGSDYLRIAEKFGAVATLKKPFRAAELIGLVAQLLARTST
ncbi:MAG TPA: response regulator [Stellaceae bacterium]|jgi:CheY-like chemotaxis protein|nr:response regulator [Stellaceae bacterium]